MTKKPEELSLAQQVRRYEQKDKEWKSLVKELIEVRLTPPPSPPPTLDQQLMQAFGGAPQPLPQPPKTELDKKIESAF